jgi:hypothetical protein
LKGSRPSQIRPETRLAGVFRQKQSSAEMERPGLVCIGHSCFSNSRLGSEVALEAAARLNAMNARFRLRLRWAVAFSFSRAIQQPASEIWKREQNNVSAAQQALYHRALCNQAARRGEYSRAMEKK